MVDRVAVRIVRRRARRRPAASSRLVSTSYWAQGLLFGTQACLDGIAIHHADARAWPGLEAVRAPRTQVRRQLSGHGPTGANLDTASEPSLVQYTLVCAGSPGVA